MRGESLRVEAETNRGCRWGEVAVGVLTNNTSVEIERYGFLQASIRLSQTFYEAEGYLEDVASEQVRGYGSEVDGCWIGMVGQSLPAPVSGGRVYDEMWHSTLKHVTFSIHVPHFNPLRDLFTITANRRGHISLAASHFVSFSTPASPFRLFFKMASVS